MSAKSELVELYKDIPGKMLTFDLSSTCNLKCVMCVWHNGKRANDPKSHLPFNIFSKTIDELCETRIHYAAINLSVSGEPLLHPDFKKIVSYLFERNQGKKLFDVLSINTNMIPLVKSTCDFLLDQLGLENGQLFLTCSLNSASKSSGEKVKGKNFHAQILNNTKYLIQRKKELGLSWRLKLDLQMLILEETLDECEEFVNIWGDVFKEQGLAYRVVGDVFCDDDNVINLKREFDKDRQQECDRRFQEALVRLGLESRNFSKPYSN